LWCRYLVAVNELQACFTGEEQRLGVFILPHAVAKVFALGPKKASRDLSGSDDDTGGAASANTDAAEAHRVRQSAVKSRPSKTPAPRQRPAKRSAAAALSLGSEEGVPALSFAKGDEPDDELPPGFSFDWGGYKDVWQDTPYEDAVTAMFAEYAVFYGRVARWTTSSAPPPMTLEEADSLAKHAETFIKEYVRPILGELNTPKVHKVLRHLLGTIRMHGHLRNANTSSNEARHKVDKLYYRRTNKIVRTFPAQIARQSQGTQAVLERLDNEDSTTIRADKLRRRRRSLARGGKLTAATKRSVHKLPRVAVGALAQRPGLGRLATILALGPNEKVPVLGQVKFLALMDCGTRMLQTLRSSVNYRSRGAWFDCVVYTVEGETQVMGETGTPTAPTLRRGTSSASVQRGRLGCCLQHGSRRGQRGVPPRGASMYAADVPAPEDGDWSISVVPISRVRRLIHVAPDFGELSVRKGVKALPARYTASVEESRAMHYHENAFFPWD